MLAWVGLGANLGDPLRTLRSALGSIAQAPATSLQACSSFYRSAPVEADGPDFFNAVAVIRTGMQPLECLHFLQALEAVHHRERPYRNAPRTLDLDLLLWGEDTLSLPELQVPHPRMHQRAFVLVPLAEISPTICIPGQGSVRGLLPAVAGQAIYRVQGEPPPFG